MLKRFSTLAMIVLGTSLFFTACKKEDDNDPTENANEEITTLKLTFVNNANAADKVVANWRDIDGIGGNAPTIDSVILKANTTYTVYTDVYDERVSPVDTVTAEIIKEGIEHRVFHLFFATANSSVADALTNVATVTPLDKDEKGLPLGLENTIATKGAFKGVYRVIIRHQPGAKDGTFAPGSTDVDTEFPFAIK
ncbi:hypothetical protein LX64_00403 [Chitinophaga skermanii]|uniref:Type 1 periplasmic binding fold superfamily protein n=1 Tax=Chitinophaga skermanii TaxID=331697 RepID=A0A327R1Q1_9BACT|nr:hypothetical protein [Chitinophaga skermanii]RAJ10796.1 hypothetical protein LX64_00403 [Chitinophaga skermanii]